MAVLRRCDLVDRVVLESRPDLLVRLETERRLVILKKKNLSTKVILTLPFLHWFFSVFYNVIFSFLLYVRAWLTAPEFTRNSVHQFFIYLHQNIPTLVYVTAKNLVKRTTKKQKKTNCYVNHKN